MHQLFACQVWWWNSKGVSSVGGSNWGGVVFDRVIDAISRKRCEIELRWQLITIRKSYVGFRLQQKSMTLNDFEYQFNALSSVLCVLWLNSWGWSYVLLTVKYQYTSPIRTLNLTTKFKGITFEFQAWFPINLSSVVCNTSVLWRNDFE